MYRKNVQDEGQTAYMSGTCYSSIWSLPSRYTAVVLNWLFPWTGLRSRLRSCVNNTLEILNTVKPHTSQRKPWTWKWLSLCVVFSLFCLTLLTYVPSVLTLLPGIMYISSALIWHALKCIRSLYFLCFPASYLLISSSLLLLHSTSLLGSWSPLCVWNLTDPGQEFALYNQSWGPSL